MSKKQISVIIPSANLDVAINRAEAILKQSDILLEVIIAYNGDKHSVKRNRDSIVVVNSTVAYSKNYAVNDAVKKASSQKTIIS